MNAPGDQPLVAGGVLASRRHVARAVRSMTVAALMVTLGSGATSSADEPVRYLAFQIFTGSFDSDRLRASFPPASEDRRKIIVDLRDRIGMTGTGRHKLGAVFGPLAFDNSDEYVRTLIADAFAIALETGVAVGFHVDDQMFWGRLRELNTPDNVEWLDWKRTPNTGRRLDWSAKPLKVMPQLCLNSAGVKRSVANRALLIGTETAKGIQKLKAAGREDLFIGVIAGWETQIGRDFDTGKNLGYCALTNAGFNAAHPPADVDREREKIVADFISLWAGSLVRAGVPKGKVYSHIAFMSKGIYDIASRQNPSEFPTTYLQTVDFTPPETAFCDSCVAGFSTYPQPGHLDQLQGELEKHGSPPWASSEGTSLDPSDTDHGAGDARMEGYLGNLFNHGATLVNIFGWGVGEADNPFRRTAEGDAALAAYRKFLHGWALAEAPLPAPVAPPPADLPDRVRKIQSLLPAWVERHRPTLVTTLMERLDSQLKQQHFEEASKTADEILRLISS
ncbi:MAG TPA: hypothetical protein VK511_13945 [Gemmatimonadaceae bacterium]|nr:hypothetical protein [Gemmatimonadaceae bacterium]